MINIKLLFKAVALTNFLLLIAIFLWSNQTAANREVRPNSEPIFTSPNGGTPAKTTIDTSSKKHYQLKRLLFSSSKSLVITDNFNLKGDTVMDRKDSTVTKKKIVRDSVQL
ncbi:MAG: hypothetical protein ACKO96_36840, partial [Flammeovirgaceae bacterium]